MSQDPVELLRQLQAHQQRERQRAADGTRAAAAAERTQSHKAEQELAALVALLKHDDIPTTPLYRLKKRRGGWLKDVTIERYEPIGGCWLITTDNRDCDEGRVPEHYVLTPDGRVLGELRAVGGSVKRHKTEQHAPQGPGFSGEHCRELPPGEAFIDRGPFREKLRLAVSAEETAQFYFSVIESNRAR